MQCSVSVEVNYFTDLFQKFCSKSIKIINDIEILILSDSVRKLKETAKLELFFVTL